MQQLEKHTFLLHHHLLPGYRDDVEDNLHEGKRWRREEESRGMWEWGGWECNYVCVSAHMAVDVFLVKLMKIEPLKASSAFCSGRGLLKQTKTKPPQSVSFCHLSLLGRQLHHSHYPSNPPPKCVCVCFQKCPYQSVYFTKGAFYDEVGEIKRGAGRGTHDAAERRQTLSWQRASG